MYKLQYFFFKSAANTSLLDILLSLKDEETNQGLSRKELYDQVVTFMFAGHEVIVFDSIISTTRHRN